MQINVGIRGARHIRHTKLRVEDQGNIKHSRKRNGFRRPLHGFTLIELVIALAMVGIIAGSLATSLRIAYRATRDAEAVVGPPQTASIALDLACDDVENALATGGIFAGNFEGTQAYDDRGHEADDLIFFGTSQSPVHVDANGEIKQLELTVEKTLGGEYVLVRRATRNLLAPAQEAPDEEVLCRDVSSLTLQYFDGSTWHLTWDSTQEDNDLPAAVQITLELELPTADARTKGQTVRYSRIVPLSCSMAALDPSVNAGVAP